MAYHAPLKDKQIDGNDEHKLSGNTSPLSNHNIGKNNLAGSVAMKELMLRSMRLKNINPKTLLGMADSKSVDK